MVINNGVAVVTSQRWVAILEKSGNRRTESDIKLLDREILSSVHFFDDMSIELRYAVLKVC